MYRLACVSAIAGALTLAAACSQDESNSGQVTEEEVREDIEEAAASTAEFIAHTKDEYRAAVEQQLDELDRDIDELKRSIEKQGDAAHAKTDEALARLDTQREKIAGELEALESSSEDAWKSLSDGVDRAIADLKDAYEDAKNELEQS